MLHAASRIGVRQCAPVEGVYEQREFSRVAATRSLVEPDLKAGVIVSASGQWTEILKEATKLAEQHSAAIGCRSLDVLHCAVDKALGAAEFMISDSRQKKLALAIGPNLVTF